MAAIFEAARAFDVEALRRELAAGVDPDLVEWGGTSAPALFNAVICGSGIRPEDQLQERLATISVLVEAGASLELGPKRVGCKIKHLFWTNFKRHSKAIFIIFSSPKLNWNIYG